MAKQDDVKLGIYQGEVKKLLRAIPFKSKGRKHGEAQRAIRRLRTIAVIMIRVMSRKLFPEVLIALWQFLGLYCRVQRQ